MAIDDNGTIGFSSDWVTEIGLMSGDFQVTAATGANTSTTIVSHNLGYKPMADAIIGASGSSPVGDVAYFNVANFPFYDPAGGISLYDYTNGIRSYVEITNSALVLHYKNISGATRYINLRYWIYENPITEEV